MTSIRGNAPLDQKMLNNADWINDRNGGEQ